MINVCFATDENYLKYMATSILSILLTSKADDNFHFYILCNEISNESKQYISNLQRFKKFNVTFIDIDIKDYLEFPAGGIHISNTTYYRYKIAEVCPNISKILYLDCDIIVNTSLSELFNIDIDNYYIAGVEDIGYVYQRKYNKSLIYKQDIYVNAGVLLINLNLWRKDKLYEKLMQYTYSNSNEIRVGDQDVINYVCKNKILKLDYKWNVQDSFYKLNNLVKSNPCKKQIINATKTDNIIHFTAINKPWNKYDTGPYLKWYNTYLILTKDEPNDNLRRKIITYKNFMCVLILWKMIITNIHYIFSITNEQTHKVIKLLYFKIKIKRKI